MEREIERESYLKFGSYGGNSVKGKGVYVSIFQVHSGDIDEPSGTCLLGEETRSESSRFSDRPSLSK